MKKLTITEAREAARKIADDAEFRRKQFVEAEASDDLAVGCMSWLEEAEAALRHIKSALDMIGGRSDPVPLIVHRAEMELKRAIETERGHE